MTCTSSSWRARAPPTASTTSCGRVCSATWATISSAEQLHASRHTRRHRPMRTKVVAGRCVGRGELRKLVAVRVED
eukprot:5110746-Prymnesium_polylepis.2